MNRPRLIPTLALLVAVCLIDARESRAWQLPSGGQATSQQIVFSPPAAGTCRAESGSVARGRIVSISEQEIVMINDQNREVTLPTNEVRTVRTTDGEFQYEPAKDDFSDAVRRATALDGVNITTIYIQQPTQPPPNQPGVGQGNPGFTNPNRPSAGVNNPPSGGQPQGGAPTYSSTPGFSNGPPAGSSSTSTSTENSSLRCASCGNVIGPDSRIGQTCPHCGVVWVSNPTFRPTVADTSSTHQGLTSTGHGGGATTVATAAGQTTPQPATVPAPAVGAGGNFSFESMPIWQKAGACIGFLAILYLVINGRR
jgi:hypothetical protein